MGILNIDILTQPDDYTCGPTCLHAIYKYYEDPIELHQVIAEVPMLAEGGTLAVFLANHALKRGYRAQIYSYNLQIFDPTWARLDVDEIKKRLIRQMEFKKSPKLKVDTLAYLEFFDLGGTLHFEDLSPSLIQGFLLEKIPIITALSATYLYKSAREYGPESVYDDVQGEPSGHFVVVSGYDPMKRTVMVADPHLHNPIAFRNKYEVSVDSLIGAIFLGIITHDAKLIIIEPKKDGSCKI